MDSKGETMRYGISAGALVTRQGQLLLVRHCEPGRYDFWVPPGGRLQGSESILECARRETLEETGLHVEVQRILYVQEFVEPGYHFVKFWFLARAVAGELTLAPGRDADESFLVEARFFAPAELRELNVLPALLRDQFWRDLAADAPARYLGMETMQF